MYELLMLSLKLWKLDYVDVIIPYALGKVYYVVEDVN